MRPRSKKLVAVLAGIGVLGVVARYAFLPISVVDRVESERVSKGAWRNLSESTTRVDPGMLTMIAVQLDRATETFRIVRSESDAGVPITFMNDFVSSVEHVPQDVGSGEITKINAVTYRPFNKGKEAEYLQIKVRPLWKEVQIQRTSKFLWGHQAISAVRMKRPVSANPCIDFEIGMERSMQPFSQL